jgi:hypothetical protein
MYGEFADVAPNLMAFPPLAEADKDTGQLQPVHPIVPEMIRVLRFNRDLGKVDRVVTRNGKCVYECVWIESNTPGVWFVPTRSISTGGCISVMSIGLVGVAASGITSGPMTVRHRKARRAIGTPTTTSLITNSIRFLLTENIADSLSSRFQESAVLFLGQRGASLL